MRVIGHGQSKSVSDEFSHDWPWPIIKPVTFVSSFHFPPKRGLIDQSPRIGRTPIGKAISSSRRIGIEGLYYVLSFADYVLELSEVCF